MLPEDALNEIRHLAQTSSSGSGGDDGVALENGNSTVAENGEAVPEFGSSLRFVDAAPFSGGDVAMEMRRWFREEDPVSGANGDTAHDNGAAFDKAWQRLQEDDADDSVRARESVVEMH